MDPDWGGASWYGTSSGTYWTLNPKEYADPRKHGPEYQARARRADERRSRMRAPASETLASDAEAVEPDDDAPPASDAGADEGPRRPAGPTHTATSWWAAEPAAGQAPPDVGAHASPRPQRATASAPTTATSTTGSPQRGDEFSSDAILDGVRHWLDDPSPALGARIGRAVIGWAPIALGIGWIIGEVSGCGRFSADCHPAAAPVSWGLQLAALVVLIARTRLARIATVATIATLAAIFPASAILLATFDPEGMTAGRAVLGGLMAAAWAAGIAYGAAREFRRKPLDRPVS